MKAKPFQAITGTFLDGLACDVPSQNWGPKEWRRQFDVFKEMRMDTVVIIRVGWRDMAMYESRVMPAPVREPDDLVQFFLDQAQRVGLRLYMGVYDNSDDLRRPAWDSEIAVNLDLLDEILERYGNHPAFHGWYLSHEPDLTLEPWRIWDPLVAKMRRLTAKRPILFSPRFEGRKWRSESRETPKEYAARFDRVLSGMTNHIDHAAFMDGHCGITELGDYAAAMGPVLQKHAIEFWSNLETFDRDMPIRFPPIDWLKMRHKLESIQPYVTKIITFEAAHFLSPYSMWDSGRHLFRRYMSYVEAQRSIPARRLPVRRKP